MHEGPEGPQVTRRLLQRIFHLSRDQTIEVHEHYGEGVDLMQV